MALSQDCRQQHHREQTLSQRWIAVGTLSAAGIHLALLPLIGFDAGALVSRSEDEPIQIIVTSADVESPLDESPSESLAAATPPEREWLEPEPPETLDEPEPEEELEPEKLDEPELEDVEEPEPEEVVDEPEPEEEVVQDSEPEPEPEVAEEPESEPAATPDPEAPADLADEAETAGAEAVAGGGKPERIAKQPAGGEAPTAPVGDAVPAVALALGPEATDGEGETAPETTELGGLLEGYFPEGVEDGLLDSAGENDVARGTGPGDRGNATENSRGSGEGRGNRTVRCRNCSRPTYPASALADGIEGEPQVSVQFDANGNVISVTLERSSGNAELDQAALASAEQWQFETGGQSGSVAVDIPFVIEGSDRHREAQRQGDRESVTLPDSIPTATGDSSRETASSTGEASTDSPSTSSDEGLANRDPESEDSTAPSDPPEEAPEALTGEVAAEEADETPHSGEAESAEPPPTEEAAESTSEAPDTAEPNAPAASPPPDPAAPPSAEPTAPPPAAPTEAAPPVAPTPEE